MEGLPDPEPKAPTKGVTPGIRPGRVYWKDVKGEIARINGTFFVVDTDGNHEVWWNGPEAAKAIAALGKKVKAPEAVKESQGWTRERSPSGRMTSYVKGDLVVINGDTPRHLASGR